MSIGCILSKTLVIKGNSFVYDEIDILTKHDFGMELYLTDCNGLVIDLTGAVASFAIKNAWSSDTYVINKALTIDEVNGKLTVELNATETELLERSYNERTYFLFEINVLGSGGFIAVISGKLNVVRGIESPV